MMTSRERRERTQDIVARLETNPDLEHITGDLCGIDERLAEYDPAFFLVRNHVEARWEVHCLGNRGDTYAFAVPYDELDQRTVDKARQVDQKRRGLRAIMRERQQLDYRTRKSADSQWQDDKLQIAKEVRSAFRHAALYA